MILSKDIPEQLSHARPFLRIIMLSMAETFPIQLLFLRNQQQVLESTYLSLFIHESSKHNILIRARALNGLLFAAFEMEVNLRTIILNSKRPEMVFSCFISTSANEVREVALPSFLIKLAAFQAKVKVVVLFSH